MSVVSRETGEHRFWVCDHADTRTCRRLIANHVPAGNTRLDTDEWQSDRGSHPFHTTVRHGVPEWVRDDDHDGRREVHCNTCEGAGIGLRTYLRACRGGHKQPLHLSVATYEAMLTTQHGTPPFIRWLCAIDRSVHTGYI